VFSVSRETRPVTPTAIEPTPPAAVPVFGDRIGLAEQFAGLLASEGTERGLIGPSEPGRLWSRHLLNCAVLGELIPDGADVMDVGSGAGLPGLVLAIARPDLSLVLVEPLLRRSSWLADVVHRLELDRVVVVRARAEELWGQRSASVVTARAVAPLDRLVAWCLPLVSPGGSLLAMKGESAATELTAALPTLERLGAQGWEVLPVGLGTLPDPTSVVQVKVGSSGLRSGPPPVAKRRPRPDRSSAAQARPSVGQHPSAAPRQPARRPRGDER
jgi:16S rRNA (guanine527-N7)-methyltransferase